MINPECTRSLEKLICVGLKEAKKEEWHTDDGKFHFMRKFNGSILLCGKRRSSFPYQCLVGPDWPMVMFVYFLIITINIGVLYAISSLGYPVIIIGGVGATIVLVSYTFTACSDPGEIYEDDYPVCQPTNTNIPNHDIESGNNSTSIQSRSPLDSTSITPSTSSTLKNESVMPMVPPINSIECGHCQLQRPYSARHCQYCTNCIDHLDHHCPWCGKCIGKKNINYFYVFVSSLCFQMYFLIGAGIYCAIYVYASAVPAGPGFN